MRDTVDRRLQQSYQPSLGGVRRPEVALCISLMMSWSLLSFVCSPHLIFIVFVFVYCLVVESYIRSSFSSITIPSVLCSITIRISISISISFGPASARSQPSG